MVAVAGDWFVELYCMVGFDPGVIRKPTFSTTIVIHSSSKILGVRSFAEREQKSPPWLFVASSQWLAKILQSDRRTRTIAKKNAHKPRSGLKRDEGASREVPWNTVTGMLNPRVGDRYVWRSRPQNTHIANQQNWFSSQKRLMVVHSFIHSIIIHSTIQPKRTFDR